MRQIKMIETNETAIVKMIAEVEGKKTARTLSVSRIFVAIQKADKQCSALGLTKATKEGCKLICEPEQLPHSYFKKSFFAEGTQAICTYIKGSWRLTEVSRVNCKPTSYGKDATSYLELSDIARQSLGRVEL